jgi:hypothetical protein
MYFEKQNTLGAKDDGQQHGRHHSPHQGAAGEGAQEVEAHRRNVRPLVALCEQQANRLQQHQRCMSVEVLDRYRAAIML